MTATTAVEHAAPPRARRSRGRGASERSERLGKYANNSSPRPGSPAPPRRPTRQDRRNTAWTLRRRLWEMSSLPRVRSCGRVTHVAGAGPTLRLSDNPDGTRTAGLAGLVSCGSPWACPTCARRIGGRRAEEITSLIAAAGAQGAGAALITLTLRHHAGNRLERTWDGLRYAWSRITSGAAYARELGAFGVQGWAAVVEVTHGAEHGWHPHLHVLVIFDMPVSDDMVNELAARWWLRWERALDRRGLSAAAHRGGLDARAVPMTPDASGALGVYLAKIAHEVTSGVTTKDGRHGNRTPFAILRDGVETGLADDIERWWEWEAASHGRRQLTWSRGIRDQYELAPEQTDEEIAAEDVGTDDLIALPAETWAAVRHLAEDLLSAAEDGGLAEACAWLDARRLPWFWATTLCRCLTKCRTKCRTKTVSSYRK